MASHGFSVETGAGGLATAFRASFGEGGPAVGFLAEYDALPGLSQKQSVVHDPEVAGGPGHGCGHNLLGTATLAAAVAMKDDLEKNGLSGTVVFYGKEGKAGAVVIECSYAFARALSREAVSAEEIPPEGGPR